VTFLELVNQIGLLIEEYLDGEEEKPKEESMCGSLKHSHWTNKSPIKVGETLPPEAKVKTGEGQLTGSLIWNGFARQEKLDKWLAGSWKQGTLEVEGFTEGDQNFSVPAGKVMKVVVLTTPRDYRVSVVTRSAATPEEREVHPRFPVFEKIDV
jgi:hypothetical protein